MNTALIGTGSLTKSGLGTLALPALPTNGLTLAAGTLQIASGSNHALTTLTNANLTLSGGKLNLTNNDLLLQGGAAKQFTLNAALTAPVSGVPYGAPAGSLITTGVLTGDQWNMLRSNAQFDGQTLVSADLALRYTYAGDANLDGAITADDYAQIDAGYLLGLTPSWLTGDFNHDGSIDGADYAMIDTNLTAQGSTVLGQEMEALHAARFGDLYTNALVNLSSVPEPASLALLGLGALSLLAKRRR